MVLHPVYCPTIEYFVHLVQADTVVFESHDNYQKQSYRNRTYIYGANSKLLLNIPIQHASVKGQAQRYTEIQTQPGNNWNDVHWKSICSAYKSSPYFEFYEDEFEPIFRLNEPLLYKKNVAIIGFICEVLGIPTPTESTKEYQSKYIVETDKRYLSQAKNREAFVHEPYYQVFQEKHGFISNLSVLDLLFNLGPAALGYLKKQTI